jgi:hypothetical protein
MLGMRTISRPAALAAVAVFLFLGALGCRPVSFVETSDPGWSSIELREGLSYDDAWVKCQDIVMRKFEVALSSKESGYARTNWLFTWTGAPTPEYRVRMTLKFTPDRKSLDIKSEAEYCDWNGWVTGTDSRLTDTLKTDIMGVIGRVTR